MFNQKGFSKIVLIIIVLILIGGAYFVFSKKDKNIPAQNTENQSSQSSQSSVENLSINGRKTYKSDQYGLEFKYPTRGKDLSIDNWKTYRNKEYGFEVKYPSDWEIINYSKDQDNRVVAFQDEPYQRFMVYSFQSLNNETLEQFLKSYYGPNDLGVFGSKIITVSDLSAIQRNEIWHAPNLEIMATYLKKGGIIFSLKREILFSEDSEIYSRILSTFKFNKQ